MAAAAVHVRSVLRSAASTRAGRAGRVAAASAYVALWAVQLRTAARFGATLPAQLPPPLVQLLLSAALYVELLKLLACAVATPPERWLRDARPPVGAALAAAGYGACSAAAALLFPLSLSALPAVAVRAGLAARLPASVALDELVAVARRLVGPAPDGCRHAGGRELGWQQRR